MYNSVRKPLRYNAQEINKARLPVTWERYRKVSWLVLMLKLTGRADTLRAKLQRIMPIRLAEVEGAILKTGSVIP